VNPLLEILNALEWDGKPRVEHFLHDVMKAEDSDYIRECSRLIFAGGIHRAFRPGCKFDDMIVLIGSQAAGKSTIVRWLNMDDQFFREIKTINGKEGIEAVRGVWIGEVSELMAMTRVKEAEAVKAYITSQEDSYRPPYQKNVQTIPRRCVFIGTTNNPQFLTDKTGNRRFYPVKCGSFAYKLYENEKIIREYIRQAWAEAVHLYKEGKLQPFARKEVLDQIRAAQEQAMEDDWRIGAIEQYLSECKKMPGATVSVIELWHRALGEPEESKPTRKDSIEITQIITNIPGWVQCPNPVTTPWGRQKVFRKDNFAALWR
jgi:predicted P-loop ATPase